MAKANEIMSDEVYEAHLEKRRAAVREACEHAAKHRTATLIVTTRDTFPEVAEMVERLSYPCRRDPVTGDIFLNGTARYPKLRLFPYTDLIESPKHLRGCRDIFIEPAVKAIMPEEMAKGIRPFLAVNNKHLHEQKRSNVADRLRDDAERVRSILASLPTRKDPAITADDVEKFVTAALAIVDRLAWLKTYRDVATTMVMQYAVEVAPVVKRDDVPDLIARAREIADGCLPKEKA
jgi:hypothetical protein